MYIAWDRPDIQFAAGMTGRAGPTPSTIDMMRVERMVRYLSHRRTMWWNFEVSSFTGKISVYVDSDWSGDAKHGEARAAEYFALRASF